MGESINEFLRRVVDQQTNDWADKYVGTDDVNNIWFGGLDLDSKNDYAHQYMSPEQIAGWGSMNPEQRKELLRGTVRSAMADDDDAFGETLIKKGVPLAIAAMGAYALAPMVAGMFGGGAGAGAGALGKAGALARFMPGESGGIPDIMRGGGGGGALGGMMPQNIGDWVKLGTTAAGALGALGGPEVPEGGPAPQPGTPLAQQTLSRQRTPAPDYFTYGQKGGEHRFFTDASFNDGPATPPASGAAPGAGALPVPTGWVPNHMLNDLPRRSVLAAASGGPTPVTATGGRTDDIEALLSEGEYVIDAETVALLGDGSTEAGSRRLDELRENVRKHKGAALAKGKFSADAKRPEEYIPGMAKGGKTTGLLDKLKKLVATPSPEEYLRMKHPQGSRVLDILEGRVAQGIDTRRRRTDAEILEESEASHGQRKAKGGRLRVASDRRKASPEDRQRHLDMMRRFINAYQQKEHPKPGEDLGGDPYNRTGRRLKRARGGDVTGARERLAEINGLAAQHPIRKAEGGAVKDLDKLGDRLELALKIGDGPEIRGAMAVPPTLLPSKGEVK